MKLKKKEAGHPDVGIILQIDVPGPDYKQFGVVQMSGSNEVMTENPFMKMLLSM